MANCPICDLKLEQDGQPDRNEVYYYRCIRCGRYGISDEAKEFLPRDHNFTLTLRAVLCFAIWRKRNNGQKNPILLYPECHELLLKGSLPNPAEQAEILLLWLGEKLESYEGEVTVPLEEVMGIIGGQTPQAVRYITDHLDKQQLVTVGLIDGKNQSRSIWFKMTFEGWQQFEMLKRATINSRTGFVAMAFNTRMLEVLNNVFRPAITAAGFNPFSLADPSPAGLIDDRMRVEIRKCRFLIADLSDDNRGAYWEGGFAEGLGRPVIYTCEESAFKNVHFDTSHLNTVKWEVGKFAEAIEKLKATIRATLPTEAKLSD
jgi:nucleoside 2-deoxyribosyltransferase